MKNVQIFVPTTINVDKAIDTSTYKHQVEKSLASWFGGFSTYTIDGGYVADNGELISEKIYAVTATCSNADYRLRRHALQLLAKQLAKDLKQECVMLQVLPVYELSFL